MKEKLMKNRLPESIARWGQPSHGRSDKSKGFNNSVKKNRQRLGGSGLSLQAFANSKSNGSYNPHLIKKQKEVYQNAKLIKKFRKSVKQQDDTNNHGSVTPFPKAHDGEVKRKYDKTVMKKKKYSLQSTREEYEKRHEEEEKTRMERDAAIQTQKEQKARAEVKRKTMRDKMFKKTRSGQPVMKYRIEHLLEGIQNSNN